MESKKLWGVYNTFENPESINQLTEYELWEKIDRLSGAIFWAQHDAGRPWAVDVPMERLIEAQYNLEYMIYSSRRFGVEFSREPSATEHLEKSETFTAWYSFWREHFANMDPEEYDQFADDYFDGKDVSKYLPTENWKDSYKRTLKQKKMIINHLFIFVLDFFDILE